MDNKKLGMILLGLGLILSFFVFTFNDTLNKNVWSSCDGNEFCFCCI